MAEQVQDYLHPFVDYLKSRLDALLTLIEFEEGGKPVVPDGFRLKDLPNWSFEKYNSVVESLGSFSSHCNLRCKFCYEEGNPIGYEKTRLTMNEASTRIRHYRKAENKGLPIFRQRLYKEPFTNKELVPILRVVRDSDPEVEMHITTNGSLLTEKTLKDLSALMPVNLCVSLNSSDPEGRKAVMGDKRSRNSIEIFKRFRKYGLPYAGSIVAWPEMGKEELTGTIRFLHENDARMIRITLPGFSKFYSGTPPFDTNEAWKGVLETVLPLRDEVSTPILVLPSLYHSPAFLPEAAGIIRNSPACRAGMRFGDVIRTVNGKTASTRSEAQELLFVAASAGGAVMVGYERDGAESEAVLEEVAAGPEGYPYRPAGYPASKAHIMGIILVDDLNPRWVADLLARLSSVKAKKILLMTSAIMEPLVAALLDALPGADELLGGRDLYLWVPEERFWGGNIVLGDLYTCSDYIGGVRDFVKKSGVEPDLVVIPSSFSPNGNTDLLGVSYGSIEQTTGIPVMLARCSQITM